MRSTGTAMFPACGCEAPTKKLGRWPFRLPLKKQSFHNLAERSQKTQFFQGGPAAFGRKVKILIQPLLR
jgi:hypothetical protein